MRTRSLAGVMLLTWTILTAQARAEGAAGATAGEGANPTPIASDTRAVPLVPAGGPDSGTPKTAHISKFWSAAGVGTVYAGAMTWVLVRYYIAKEPADHLTIQSDGWFGADTYAGGADKLGHMWGNYALTRGCSEILIAGGWDELAADLMSAGLAMTFYTWSEFTDGYYGWGFSYSDLVFNAVGNGLGVLMRRWRGLDDAIDLRISYFPSRPFMDKISQNGFLAAGEDYSGQTFLVAFHLKSLPPVRNERWLSWLQYVDLTAGYRTSDYEPLGPNPRQQLLIGLSLNLQHVLRGLDGAGGGVARFGAEVWQPPFTSIDMVGMDRAGARRVVAKR